MIKHSFGLVLACAALLAAAPSARAQQTPPTQAVPVAKPADVNSPEAILAALYDVISGPAGQKRDWDRFRSLFVPGAHLIPVRSTAEGASARMLTPDEYATTAGAGLERNGFFEKEIHKTVESFGNIMHVFSTYESRRTAADPQPFARGINSIQLMKDGNRWWVVNVYWDSERAGNPIPAKYLPK